MDISATALSDQALAAFRTPRGRFRPGVMLAWIRAHVDHEGDECLIWPFTRFPSGYARLAEPGTNRTSGAARVMCTEAHGPPPQRTYHCRHLCGNGINGCVHPKHLAWGTVLENAADRVKHGRSQRGEDNWQAKLNDDDVREIRLMLEVASVARIARCYDVSLPTIKDIKAKRTWSWLE